MTKKLIDAKTKLKVDKLHHSMSNLKIAIDYATTDKELKANLIEVLSNAQETVKLCEYELDKIENKNQPTLFKKKGR